VVRQLDGADDGRAMRLLRAAATSIRFPPVLPKRQSQCVCMCVGIPYHRLPFPTHNNYIVISVWTLVLPPPIPPIPSIPVFSPRPIPIPVITELTHEIIQDIFRHRTHTHEGRQRCKHVQRNKTPFPPPKKALTNKTRTDKNKNHQGPTNFQLVCAISNQFARQSSSSNPWPSVNIPGVQRFLHLGLLGQLK